MRKYWETRKKGVDEGRNKRTLYRRKMSKETKRMTEIPNNVDYRKDKRAETIQRIRIARRGDYGRRESFS